MGDVHLQGSTLRPAAAAVGCPPLGDWEYLLWPADQSVSSQKRAYDSEPEALALGRGVASEYTGNDAGVTAEPLSPEGAAEVLIVDWS